MISYRQSDIFERHKHLTQDPVGRHLLAVPFPFANHQTDEIVESFIGSNLRNTAGANYPDTEFLGVRDNIAYFLNGYFNNNGIDTLKNMNFSLWYGEEHVPIGKMISMSKGILNTSRGNSIDLSQWGYLDSGDIGYLNYPDTLTLAKV